MNIRMQEVPIMTFLTVGLILEYHAITLGKYTGITLTILYLYITKLLWIGRWPFMWITLGTLILEIIGLHSGFPFGKYQYGQTVAEPAIFNVPIFIPLAWFILINATKQITAKWYYAVLTIIGIDIILENFATTTGLWTWQNHTGPLTAPIQNYITWGITTAIGYFIIPKNNTHKQTSQKIITMLLAYMLIVIGIHKLK